jgi:hypothetical protein
MGVLLEHVRKVRKGAIIPDKNAYRNYIALNIDYFIQQFGKDKASHYLSLLWDNKMIENDKLLYTINNLGPFQPPEQKPTLQVDSRPFSPSPSIKRKTITLPRKRRLTIKEFKVSRLVNNIVLNTNHTLNY